MKSVWQQVSEWLLLYLALLLKFSMVIKELKIEGDDATAVVEQKSRICPWFHDPHESQEVATLM